MADLVRLLGDHKVREILMTDKLHALALTFGVPLVTAIEIVGPRDGDEC